MKSFITICPNIFPGLPINVPMNAESLVIGISSSYLHWVITCLVVNPANIPSSHKDKVYKTDIRESRGIGQALAKGQLRGIYIPPLHQEADRNLVRQRKKNWRDLVR